MEDGKARLRSERSGSPRIAVVGGGWAGCAAAVTLADAGAKVTIFEQAKTLGGRARRVIHSGLAIDNGQHLLIGAYRQTLSLIDLVHGASGASAPLRRLRLALLPFGTLKQDAVRISAWPAPAPLNLAGGALSAHGLSWSERIALIADYRRLARAEFRRPEPETVAECFAGTPPRAFAAIWGPLCLSALNTPPETASAQMFANVLRGAFGGRARHSDLLVPATDLSALFPDAAARYIESLGGTVRAGIGIRAVAMRGPHVALTLPTGAEIFDATIVAVGPHQLAATIGSSAPLSAAARGALGQVASLAYEPIATIYLGYAGPVSFAAPLLRLDDAPGQWVFDRSDVLAKKAQHGASTLLAVVISGPGAHDSLEHARLARDADAQLRRMARELPSLAWSRVIVERRATYSCRPGVARPAAGRLEPGIYLAGDYTDPDFPPTLEAATRSGVAAAKTLLADRRSG